MNSEKNRFFSSEEMMVALGKGYKQGLDKGEYLKGESIGDGMHLAFLAGAAWACGYLSRRVEKIKPVDGEGNKKP